MITGAADYNTAIRLATRNLAEKGVRVIEYESGVHTSLEAAVRRNIMGGLGLMQEQIAQMNHDQLGADGWEISAHAAAYRHGAVASGKAFFKHKLQHRFENGNAFAALSRSFYNFSFLSHAGNHLVKFFRLESD